jgi:uncharacterized protein YciI
MHFAIYCLDKTGHQQIRANVRPAHLEFLKQYLGQIVTAGPLLDDEGAGMIGSLFIVDFPDRAAADAFAAGDPYGKAGLFASVRITPWRKVIPAS